MKRRKAIPRTWTRGRIGSRQLKLIDRLAGRDWMALERTELLSASGLFRRGLIEMRPVSCGGRHVRTEAKLNETGTDFWWASEEIDRMHEAAP